MHRNASRPDWQQALAAYVEPLAVERRVAVVGDAASGLAAKLAELGARSVFAWDPDVERARREADRAPHGVIVRALVPGADGGMQRGAFDLAVVADLALFEDAEGLLVRVRRWVGDDGAAVIAIPDGAGTTGTLDYYGLFDLVARQFEHVTMIAQLPFFGVALAELGDEDDADHPSVTVDMQLAARDRQPEAFVALASQRGVRLDPYAIIELPSAPPVDDTASVAAALAAREDLAEAARRVSALEEALRFAQARAASVSDLEASLQARTARAALVPDLEASLHAVTARLSELEGALHARASHAAHLEAALAERTREVGLLTEELERARAGIEVGRLATAKLDELLLRAERAEAGLSTFDSEVSRLHDAHAGELGRYEEALRERSQAARVLEAELVRRERMVQELVGALEDSMGPGAAPAPAPEAPSVPAAVAVTPPDDSERRTTELPGRRDEDAREGTLLREANARLRSQLDSMALDLARREGEAQAIEWTVAELGRKLEAAQARAPATDDNGAEESSSRLAATLDELDALRQALAQEHDARVRAESGVDLAEARAEIQRQAALLDELRDRPG
jgi:hypothetical protein